MKKSHKLLNFILLLSVMAETLILASCIRHSDSEESSTHVRDLKEILDDDTLRVVTMYGPTSYFLYKDNEAG